MSVTRRIDLADFGEALMGTCKATLDQQKAVVADSLARAIPRLVAASPVDTGLYAQSWSFEVDDVKATLGNYAPQAAIIEYGAKRHVPPIKPLLAWAKRKLKDPSQPPNYSPEVWLLARGVQGKIAERGQEPLHILEKELPNILRDVRKALERYA